MEKENIWEKIEAIWMKSKQRLRHGPRHLEKPTTSFRLIAAGTDDDDGHQWDNPLVMHSTLSLLCNYSKIHSHISEQYYIINHRVNSVCASLKQDESTSRIETKWIIHKVLKYCCHILLIQDYIHK